MRKPWAWPNQSRNCETSSWPTWNGSVPLPLPWPVGLKVVVVVGWDLRGTPEGTADALRVA